MPIELRDAVPGDAEVIVEYNRQMAVETEGRELPIERIGPGVRAVFENPGRASYLVAVAEDEIVGTLMITTEWSDWRNGFFWWIQSVFVRPDYRRRGVYRRMHEAVCERAAAAGACGCRLYVDKENRNAQAVYSSLGMVITDYRLFEEVFS